MSSETTKKSAHWALWLAVAASASCGTVVGNPKKPGDGNTPPTATVYQLPLIDFEVPADATTGDAAALHLVQAFDQDQDKGLLLAWGQRLDRVVKRVNAISARVNGIVAKQREDGDGEEVLRFAAKGDDAQLSGRIGPATGDAANEGFAYEALLCHAGTPFAWLLWSDDGKKLRLTRDFSRSDRSDETFELSSRIDMTVGDVTTLDIVNHGRVDGAGFVLPNAEGNGVTERSRAVKSAGGDIELKATSDRYDTVPDAGGFEGDGYITGRLLRLDTSDAAGTPQYATEFVGYFKGFKLLCAGGFDEEAADLWSPDRVGPRFCIGRPKAAKRFASFEQFVETTAALQQVGIIPAADLEAVTLPDGLSCE